jgi:hypothetical protein
VGSDEPIVAASAYQHGVGPDDILHAYRNPFRAWDLGEGLIMVIGANRAGVIFEIGYVEGDPGVVVVHAMRARKKSLKDRW